jgi:hypothetical protein
MENESNHCAHLVDVFCFIMGEATWNGVENAGKQNVASTGDLAFETQRLPVQKSPSQNLNECLSLDLYRRLVQSIKNTLQLVNECVFASFTPFHTLLNM